MSEQMQTPFGAALAFQRGAARMGQRTFEQGMEAQRVMTESFIRNSLGMGRVANRTTTQLTRQNAAAVAGMMDLLFPGTGSNARASVEGGFDAVLDAQESAWRVVEESAEDALATFGNVSQSQQELVGESMSSTIDAHERMATGAGDAAVEYERQAPEGIGTGRERGAGGETETTAQQPDTEETVEPHETVTTSPESETAAEPEVETPERAEPSAAGASEVGLDDISGVGAAYAKRLESAGIESVDQLLDADVAELSEETEISDERIANWQRQARHLLERDAE